MKRARCTILLTGILSLGFPIISIAADIHKLVDNHGRVIFTNDPARGIRQIQPLKSGSSGSTASSYKHHSRTGSITIATTGEYPKVSKFQQDQRDSKRRQILAQELVNETRLLEDAMKTISLTQQKTKKYSPSHPYFASDHFDILQLRNQAAAHERNIEALEMELRNL
ncbi:hypothetical protein [Nitrosomonas sp.]|uniref:hypothetical protein n=1 Tax=Nitrosomonas sp. TaxID=42353 RepID=UPI0025F5A276|nr:hypothetical protein [Nitrosomonas sp.]MCC6916852.1 hypothetical protein [Nitrosomonas sp.]